MARGLEYMFCAQGTERSAALHMAHNYVGYDKCTLHYGIFSNEYIIFPSYHYFNLIFFDYVLRLVGLTLIQHITQPSLFCVW